VLVLHGADDPSVPPDEVRAFEDEMRAAKVDWQLVSYGNTVHSFTDPDANVPGRAQYNAPVAKRAFRAMNEFFGELFGG
jgi:dienelactone hydrolase